MSRSSKKPRQKTLDPKAFEPGQEVAKKKGTRLDVRRYCPVQNPQEIRRVAQILPQETESYLRKHKHISEPRDGAWGKPPFIAHRPGRPSAEILFELYKRLYDAFGPQHWWPARSPFEVIVGAILTQNTSWSNVAKAIANLKAARCLSPSALRNIPNRQLAALIKPSGYFNIKTKRLKNFIHFMFKAYDGSLKRMAREELPVLRNTLLAVNGIGPETADSILLYALEKPVFVIDAYTKRILHRHRLGPGNTDYGLIQKFFMAHLPVDVSHYNEFHALFVRLGSEICRPRPLCHRCPLRNFRYSLTRRCQICYRYLPAAREQRELKGPQAKRQKNFHESGAAGPIVLCTDCFESCSVSSAALLPTKTLKRQARSKGEPLRRRSHAVKYVI